MPVVLTHGMMGRRSGKLPLLKGWRIHSTADGSDQPAAGPMIRIRVQAVKQRAPGPGETRIAPR